MSARLNGHQIMNAVTLQFVVTLLTCSSCSIWVSITENKQTTNTIRGRIRVGKEKKNTVYYHTKSSNEGQTI